MEKFFDRAGPMALGSRMRLLSERLTQEASRVYAAYGLDFEPRWLPVLCSLMEADGRSVMELAQDIGQSQAGVSQVVKELSRRELVTTGKSETDGRRTVVSLTTQARDRLPAFRKQIADVGAAMETVLAQSHHNLWQALGEFEDALDTSGLYDRVAVARKSREGQTVAIVPFEDTYRDAFRSLNIAWITRWFVMEPSDYKALDHPEAIIADGGAIFMALIDGEPVGCCAMMRMDDGGFEMAKMAVSPKAQGRSVGFLLGEATITEARRRGACRVYLESNTVLKPAMRLYQKLGFTRIVGAASPYARCNIQMELALDAGKTASGDQTS